MNEELTNLLPADKKKANSRLYNIRLASVIIFLLSFIVLSAVAFRVPVYLYEYQETQIHQQSLSLLTSRLNDTQGKEVSVRFKALNDDISYISRLATSSSATAVVDSLLNVPHQGVTLSGLSYSPSMQGTDGKITLTGTAATREALHRYVDALNSQPNIKNADLPINVYAKESDIPFTITLIGTFSP